MFSGFLGWFDLVNILSSGLYPLCDPLTSVPLWGHVSNWQQRKITGMIDARSVNVKKHTNTNTRSSG